MRESDAEAGTTSGVFILEFSAGRGISKIKGRKWKGARGMRETRMTEVHLRSRTPLAVRGSSTHTFRSLGLFAEVGLLCSGCYLLAEAMLSPLKAGVASVLGGGLFLSLATVLLFYLAWPTYAKCISRREAPRDEARERFARYTGEPMEPRGGKQWALEKEEELPGPM
jgi:hypothetical protein